MNVKDLKMKMNIFSTFLIFLLVGCLYYICSKLIKKHRKTKFELHDSKKHWKLGFQSQEEDSDSEKQLLNLLEDNETE